MWLTQKLETPGGRYAIAAVVDKFGRSAKDKAIAQAMAEAARWLRVQSRPK